MLFRSETGFSGTDGVGESGVGGEVTTVAVCRAMAGDAMEWGGIDTETVGTVGDCDADRVGVGIASAHSPDGDQATASVAAIATLMSARTPTRGETYMSQMVRACDAFCLVARRSFRRRRGQPRYGRFRRISDTRATSPSTHA